MNETMHVAKKELQEMFRDKRVRSSAFFGPIILIVVLMSIFGFIFGQLGKKQNTKIHVVNAASPYVDVLKSAQFQVIEVKSVEEGKKLVEKGDARVLVAFPESVNEAGQTVVDAYVDPKNQTGQIAMGMVNAVFAEANKKQLTAELQERGIPESAMESIKVAKHDIQVGEKRSASDMLIGFLPYLIVIWAFYGGMSIAGDLVAGEKEKNTLETLLITPVRRTQIVLGKFLALSVVCLLSSMSSLVGLILLAFLPLPGMKEMFKDGFGVTPVSALLILVLMLPLVAFFASLLIGISSYAKNSRESQTYLTQVSFIVILPAIFSQFIGFTDFANAQWVNAVPILNTANNIRLALLGKPDFLGIAITVVVSLILALIALKVTVQLFNREEVLVRV